MTRQLNLGCLLALALCALAWVVVLAIVLAACQPASGVSPQAWRPLPTSAFFTWPIDPLVRPIRSASPGSAEPVRDASGTTPAQSAVPVAPKQRPSSPPSSRLTGQATWWNSWGSGLYAAAGPRLRSAMGPGYLHRYVTACARGVCVRVRLITSCACQPPTRLIDLSADAFAQLAPLGMGIVLIEVHW